MLVRVFGLHLIADFMCASYTAFLVVIVCMRVCVRAFVCMCVYVCERETETESKLRTKKKGRKNMQRRKEVSTPFVQENIFTIPC